MRYLAIDYGLKRLGLALSDPGETIVSPLCQLSVDVSRPARIFEKLREVIAEHDIDAVVVGLPLHMDDSEGEQAKVSRHFAEQLIKEVAIPVHLQDERLSSMAADEMLAESGLSKSKQKRKRDMLAACDILQEFLYKKVNG
jgi:putative Holliday junction resolvase